MSRLFCGCLVLLLTAPVPQPPQKKPFEQQSTSTIGYKNENRTEAIEIKNVSYELTGPGIFGRPRDERLVLRKTTRTRQVVDEIGMDASTTVEAWPLGVDPKEKPLYSITVPGVDPTTINGAAIVISRGLEQVEWWSVHRLGTGEHLFDTHVPVTPFSITRETQTLRYAGLEVPPDDTADRRLKAPNVVGVLIYASAERVIREALITCDDPKTAQLLRSFADSSRSVVFDGQRIRISISQNYPLPPRTIAIDVPVARDDLELTRSQAPTGLHVAAWKR